jgi:hypothetical protein
MDNKKLTNFTLVDVIEAKIHFIKTNTIFDEKDFKDNDEGELLAYNELLSDAKEMNKNEFLSKYLKIVNRLYKQLENEEFKDKKQIDKISGYNNAIVSVLKCINPIYEYDLND